MDKILTAQIADEAEAALQAIAKAHGLTVRGKGGQYTADSCTLRFEFATLGKDGRIKDKAFSDLVFMLPVIGLSEGDLDRVWKSPLLFSGAPFVLAGYNARAHKNKFIVQRMDTGKQYVISRAVLDKVISESK